MTLWPIGFTRSSEKLKSLNLHYYSVYNYSAQQSGGLSSSDSLITGSLSCLISWQSKNISQLLQYLWAPNLERWWHTIKSYLIFQSRAFLRSSDILNISIFSILYLIPNILYLHFHKPNNHHIWQSGDCP